MEETTDTSRRSKEELVYEEARRLVRERMRARMRNGACCDEIEAKLWLQELTRRNVTIFCDKLVLDDIKENKQGFIVITTKTGDYIVGKERSEPAAVILEVNPSYVKEYLIVPNDNWEGYYKLGEGKRDLVFTDSNSRKVGTSPYGHQYILNFTVGGEFKLEIGYFVQGDEDIRMIFKKGFCCK